MTIFTVLTVFSNCRPQLEYGLAINAIKYREFKKLESCQNQYLRRIFGGGSRSSTKVMLHLVNQPVMNIVFTYYRQNSFFEHWSYQIILYSHDYSYTFVRLLATLNGINLLPLLYGVNAPTKILNKSTVNNSRLSAVTIFKIHITITALV